VRSIAASFVIVALAGCTSWGSTTTTSLDSSREAAVLLAEPLPDLVFEFDFLDGHRPSEFALEALRTVAEEQTLKRAIIFLEPTVIPARDAHRAGMNWKLDEITAVESAVYSSDPEHVFVNGSAAVIHVVYLDSILEYEYRGNATRAAGLSAGNVIYVFDGQTDAARFKDTRIPYPEGVPAFGEQEREAGVLLHEFGHAMGLVANGIPMVRSHNDPDDPQHSRNPESIMSGGWDLVDESRAQVLRGDSPSLWFDDDDLADIAAFRKSHS
jgi:hypothetical protein